MFASGSANSNVNNRDWGAPIPVKSPFSMSQLETPEPTISLAESDKPMNDDGFDRVSYEAGVSNAGLNLDNVRAPTFDEDIGLQAENISFLNVKQQIAYHPYLQEQENLLQISNQEKLGRLMRFDEI